MSIHPLTNCSESKSLQRYILAALSWLLIVAPAVAQTTSGIPPIVTNSDSTFTDVNPGTAYAIRANYGKRYPFMWDAFNKDALEKINVGTKNANPGGTTSTGPTAGGGPTPGKSGSASTPTRNQTTNAQQATAATSAQDTGNVNIKKSQLWQGAPNQQVVYDTMVQPFGQPGHYVPGALPNHIPQYGSMTDAACIQYAQPQLIGNQKPKTMRDRELFDNQLQTFAVPMSDTQFQMIDREDNQRMLELAFDPERVMWLATSIGQLTTNSSANALAGSAQAAFDQATRRIVTADSGSGGGGGGGGGGAAGGGGAQVGALINIANEQSGVPTASDNPNKTVPQAVWMVQQMYKFVFVPMAILFLLPGAVITQVKGQIAQGFRLNAEDQSSPFEGILRSMIAVFLIPATQLIVSYSIDVGNSMTYSVKDWVSIPLIFDWSAKMMYNTPLNTVDNYIKPPGAGDDGMGGNVQENNTVAERQLWLSSVMEVVFNMATYLFSTFVIILGAYQLVFLCYLFLLGPLAAAFFAWPKLQNPNSQQLLFRDVFSNWVNAVMIVSLWRFYWMVILAIMTQRILYMQDMNAQTNVQWEVAVFTCLLGLMLYVPFNPWSFDPGAAFQAASTAGPQMMQGMSQALGNAAIAGGASPSAVAGVQNQINQALQPMSQIATAMNNSSYGVVNPTDPYSSSSGASGAPGATTGAASNPYLSSGAGGTSTPPPTASPTGSTSPANTAAPAAAAANQPPVAAASAAASPSVQAVADVSPSGSQVSQMSNPVVPLSASNSGASLSVNPNVSSPENGMPQVNATLMAMNMSGGGGNQGGGMPLTSGGGGGGGSTAAQPEPVGATAAAAPAPTNPVQVADAQQPPNQSPQGTQGNQGSNDQPPTSFV